MTILDKHRADITERPVVIIEGPTGPSGGEIGPAGPEGAAALTGPTGPAGPAGPIEIGPTGPGAVFGPTGAQGATGPADIGFTGPWGDWGEQGVDGPTGASGPQGRVGPIGMSNAPTGASGASGPSGMGNVCGVSVPFFTDPNIWLTPPMGEVGRFPLPLRSTEFGAHTLYLFPVWVPFPRTFTQIAVESAHLNNYSSIRFGIYDCTQDMHPTVPLYDSGALGPPVGKGLITSPPFSLPLSAKPYYFAYLSNESLSFKYLSAVDMQAPLGWRRYPDGVGYDYPPWKFEACTLIYTAWNWGMGPLPDLTSMAEPDLRLSSSNNMMLMGIR